MIYDLTNARSTIFQDLERPDATIEDLGPNVFDWLGYENYVSSINGDFQSDCFARKRVNILCSNNV